ncbi:GDSL-type esterase/lipase family protein [Saccharibacillus sp. CPCC 101409]|uniref:stalk domain-containing protein n=1 Tax=Saccharibacillus sp. CPCC 101409 TaxID=3058041 RepID=UPI0026713002|nr:GDSL-type esterase/lipase family protein [Saccharibacillus sp. CPCC 101409]MDO3412670.1 GDSL-type esterase/lipase family protein [Saccharibacillus sp. CPCC 101409]
MKFLFKKSLIALAGTALALPLLGGAANPPRAEAAAAQAYKIVSFGDSLTVGYQPDKASADYYGFVPRLLEQGLFHGRTEVDNYGISGLNSTGLEHYVEAIKSGTPTTADAIQPGLRDPNASVYASNPSKARADVADADVITITIGGNDLLPLLTTGTLPSEAELTPQVTALLQTYAVNVGEVLGDLREINPDARIVIADQYQPIPSSAAKDLYPALNRAAQSYTTALDGLVSQQNAAGGHVEAVHVVSLFAGRELQLTHIRDQDIHPNQAGYELLAQAFAKTIWGEYRTLNKTPDATTLAVVVSGKELNTAFKPIVKNGTTFVVLRDITDALGAALKWENKTSTASMDYNGRSVSIPVGQKTIKVNGQAVTVKIPAFTQKVNGQLKTYVPLAVLADGLGFDVQYNARLRTVFVSP